VRTGGGFKDNKQTRVLKEAVSEAQQTAEFPLSPWEPIGIIPFLNFLMTGKGECSTNTAESTSHI